MPDYTLRTWIARQINVRQRLERVCACYLLFLMVVTTKHTLEEAAPHIPHPFSGFGPILTDDALAKSEPAVNCFACALQPVVFRGSFS
jgi:hypothetical protein